jgi:5-formyltetrahydrofolate cyclo-ligase
VETKAEWRAWSRDLNAATPEESAAVTGHVEEFLVQRTWRKVLTFLSMPGEVDLSALGGQFDLFVTRTPTQGALTIHRLTADLETHPFGYRQPKADAPQIAGDEIEVVLVPGVLFAEDGGRLGHGRGYYDSLLSRLTPDAFKLGITLDRRVITKVPMTPNDVYMDAIATETGIMLTTP